MAREGVSPPLLLRSCTGGRRPGRHAGLLSEEAPCATARSAAAAEAVIAVFLSPAPSPVQAATGEAAALPSSTPAHLPLLRWGAPACLPAWLTLLLRHAVLPQALAKVDRLPDLGLALDGLLQCGAHHVGAQVGCTRRNTRVGELGSDQQGVLPLSNGVAQWGAALQAGVPLATGSSEVCCRRAGQQPRHSVAADAACPPSRSAPHWPGTHHT